MSKHWSADVCILCWRDPRSAGRCRMSWGSREYLERLAAQMSDEHDARLYDGFGSAIKIRPSDAPLETMGDARARGRKPKARRKPDPTTL